MSAFFIVTGIVSSLALVIFAVTSLGERERRAAVVSFFLAGGFLASWLAVGALFSGSTDLVAAVFCGVAALSIAALWLPIGKKVPLRVDESAAVRIDERDIMFARMRLEEGSPEYAEYYEKLRPELAETDRKIRALPDLGEPGGMHFVDRDTSYSTAVFRHIENMSRLAGPDEAVRGERAEIPPPEATKRLKSFARCLGAADVRVAILRDRHVYSHVGRGAGGWGDKIRLDHRFAVVFSVEMDHRMTRNAPLPALLTESAIGYLRSADIAVSLANYCALLGYGARAHIDGDYRVLAAAVAHDAGLGELGRIGLLVTPRLGPRVRLGVVTTDLPLVEDGEINIGVQHFCEICKKCADNCPSGAISSGEKSAADGVTKWRSNQEACYRMWRKLGTDCGICVAVCPYSKPDAFFHRVIRYFCRRSAPARRIALLLDDVFYGKKPRHRDLPDWFSREAYRKS